jgi:hypothetical protein
MLFGILAAICGAAGREATGKDKQYIGVCLFVIGLIATIGLFASFTAALIFVDPFLVLIGGIIECRGNEEGTIVYAPPKSVSASQQHPPFLLPVKHPPLDNAMSRENSTESVKLQVNEEELVAPSEDTKTATKIFGDELEAEDKAESTTDNQLSERRKTNDSLSAAQIEALQDEMHRLKDELTFDCDVIAAKEARIAEQVQEIEQLKDFITKVSVRVAQPQPPPPSTLPQSNGLCVRCGFQNISEAIYCRQCGTKLESSPEPPKLLCPSCGREIEDVDAAFCSYCGANLPKDER